MPVRMRGPKDYAASVGAGPEDDRVRDRVDRAKTREVAAHRRAIQIHEQAAGLFERRAEGMRAQAARQRAQRARDMLALALTEAAQYASSMDERGKAIGPGA